MTMTDAESAALLHITNSPHYIPGMLTVAHSGDSRDASLMLALTKTSRDYPARLEQAAFLGMIGREIYIASGRAWRDCLQAVARAVDLRDYQTMRNYTRDAMEAPVSPWDAEEGAFVCIAHRRERA